jgi:hypothetical protein
VARRARASMSEVASVVSVILGSVAYWERSVDRHMRQDWLDWAKLVVIVGYLVMMLIMRPGVALLGFLGAGIVVGIFWWLDKRGRSR